MKTRITFFTAALGLSVLCAWSIKQTRDINKAEWLIGTWEYKPTIQAGKTSQASIYETWIKIKDIERSGISYLINEKDTNVFETIQIIQETKALFYIPILKNQNDGLPERFEAKSISETRLVFENPNHDFPQTISYKKINIDALVAEISGIKNGQLHKQTFPMKRVN